VRAIATAAAGLGVFHPRMTSLTWLRDSPALTAIWPTDKSARSRRRWSKSTRSRARPGGRSAFPGSHASRYPASHRLAVRHRSLRGHCAAVERIAQPRYAQQVFAGVRWRRFSRPISGWNKPTVRFCEADWEEQAVRKAPGGKGESGDNHVDRGTILRKAGITGAVATAFIGAADVIGMAPASAATRRTRAANRSTRSLAAPLSAAAAAATGTRAATAAVIPAGAPPLQQWDMRDLLHIHRCRDGSRRDRTCPRPGPCRDPCGTSRTTGSPSKATAAWACAAIRMILREQIINRSPGEVSRTWVDERIVPGDAG
jgi:hypothetical protein